MPILITNTIQTATDDELAAAASAIQAEQDARYRATGGPPLTHGPIEATMVGHHGPIEAATLAERVGEFRTLSVVRIGDDFFAVDTNGGTRGAWEVRYDQHATTTRSIDRTEARRILLEMETEPEEAARLTTWRE
jgi:hypothetical protein